MITERIDNESFDRKLIKQHRRVLGMTQDDLAEWMGESRSTIQRIENSDITISTENKKKLNHFLKIQSKEELYGTLTDNYGVEYNSLPTGNYLITIPYIPISNYNDFACKLDLGELKVNHIVDSINSGFYIAIQVNGEAMDDGSRISLRKGDIAVCMELDKEHIDIDENTANIWVVIFENKIWFRKAENTFEKECVLLKAINPSISFADLELEIESITKIYKVIQRQTNF